MVLGDFNNKAKAHNENYEPFISASLYKNASPELDSRCVEFIERKKLEIENGQFSQLNSFWNPANFAHYNNCDTPPKLYNEISFNLSSGTSLNNECLGLFISQIGNVISTFAMGDLFDTSYHEHRQLTGLFHNEEPQTQMIEELSYIFLSIRLLFEIHHLSPDEYIKSLVISQILKNRETIHLVFTYSARLPRISYAVASIDSIYSMVESISAPKDGFFDKYSDDNLLGLPQSWICDEKGQNFLVKIIADSLTNNSLKNRIFGTEIANIAPITAATNGNLLYLLKSNLSQCIDQISECVMSNAVVDALQNIICFVPESVAIHFTTLLYPKHSNFKVEHFSQHIRFINHCSSLPLSIANCCHVAYNLCWQTITSLNQNIARVTSTEVCLPIIELLCKYYECTSKLVYNDTIASQQCVELVTLCLRISQQPFSEITNKIHCSVFNSLITLHKNGKIDASIIYLTLINFDTNLSGLDILDMTYNYTLEHEKCYNFLYNHDFKQFLQSNISQIGYIVLKICFDSLVSVNITRDTHISYKGAQRNVPTNLDRNDQSNIDSDNELPNPARLSRNIDIVDCIKLGIDVIRVASNTIASSKWNDIRQLILLISKIYSICLSETINDNVDKLLLKEMTECIIYLFKQLITRDHYIVCRLFRAFTEMIKRSSGTRYSRKYFEACLLDNYDTQSQILYYISIRYFEAINLPLPIFKCLPVQYYAFDTTTLNLSIFKSYFLGPYNIPKITLYQGTYRIISIDFYHSWQNVLKTHITKLYPILIKSENLALEIGKVHHIFAYGCVSSGLFQLAANYFDQITHSLITYDSTQWYTILHYLCSNKLSQAMEGITMYHTKQLCHIDKMMTYENRASRVSYYCPEPILLTWLHSVISLQKLYNEFLDLLGDKSTNMSKMSTIIGNTMQIIISLKLIDSMLSTKSTYSRYSARLYLAKAKLLHHFQCTLYQEAINETQFDARPADTMGEGMYNIIGMLDQNVLDKLTTETIGELEFWSNDNLGVFWAMDFVESSTGNGNIWNEHGGQKYISFHPTVYFRAINDIFTRNPNTQISDIANITKEINELTLPIPLIMLFPKPLFYVPLVCIIKFKVINY